MVKIYTKHKLKEIADILNNNGIVSVPTDTVFGLCASINSKEAYNKLVKIKGRPNNKAFPIMCTDIDQIKEIAIVNKKEELFIKRIMPGPITIILNKKNNLPNYITNNQKTIAIRMAPTKELEDIINIIKKPLFMTSANKSGEKPCNSIKEIKKVFPDIDCILEGDVSFSIPSTIVDLTGKEIKVLREGPIKLEEIEKVINGDIK